MKKHRRDGEAEGHVGNLKVRHLIKLIKNLAQYSPVIEAFLSSNSRLYFVSFP